MASWGPLTTPSAVAVDTMLLLTDGGVMCHVYGTANWHKLVPDAQGDYVNGTWQSLASMPANAPTTQNGPTDAPLYYASAVLKDGRVFVAGGEYNVNYASGVDLLAVEIYDPVSDSWSSLPNPPGWTNIGDAPTCVLPDGRLLLGNINAVGTAIYDPVANTWSTGGNKHDTSSEETWTLLPNQTILVAEVNNHPQSERYDISTGTWISDSNIPAAADLVLNVPGVSIEIGPAILMPNGKVFATGASGHCAIYTSGATATSNGTWVAGPNFPKDSNGNLMRAFDAPACLLPSGHVLCVAGPVITSGIDTGWAGQPTNFFEYDGTNLNQITGPSNAASLLTFNCRLLCFPPVRCCCPPARQTSRSISRPATRPRLEADDYELANRGGSAWRLQRQRPAVQWPIASGLLRRRRPDGHQLPASAHPQPGVESCCVLPHTRSLHHGRGDRRNDSIDPVRRPPSYRKRALGIGRRRQ